MTRPLILVVPILTLLLTTASLADVITVDGVGGADYLTIQEAVDAASWGDTVLVHPGTYTAVEDTWCGGYTSPVCVCIRSSLTLVSSDGPDVTIVDGEGQVVCGVLVEWGDPVVIDGFTITTNASTYIGDAAIVLDSGEVRNNILTGFPKGVTTDMMWYWPAGAESYGVRDATVLIDGNDIDCTNVGVQLYTWGSSETDVIGNTISGGQEAGVSVYGVGDVRLIGNEISGGTMGVAIRNPSHNAGAQYAIEMVSNRIIDNTDVNIDIHLWEGNPGSVCEMTIGGSPESANDMQGSAVNLRAYAWDVALSLDATHNFWGSVACTTLVPLFDIHESVPDSAFVFEPFVDESHTQTYDCQGVPVRGSSWGAIKALYR